MRPKIYEFIVKGVVSGGSGLLKVIGRCGDIPIQIGDQFDVVYDYKPHKFPEESGRAPVRCREKPVALRVVWIRAYERSLPELGEGMTGSLALEGDETLEVVPGWVLGRKESKSSPTPSIVGSSEQPSGD